MEYCFAHAYAERCGEDSEEEIDAREAPFRPLMPIDIARNLCQLFDSCEMLVDRFIPDQIASGVWFIFGCGSSYIAGEVMDPSVPENLQVATYEKGARMYTHCFDVLCNRRGTTSEYMANVEKIDGAVYMIWDMDQIQWPLYEPSKSPGVAGAGYRTLETVLRDCQTASCLHSALHGLGHAIFNTPDPGRSIIEQFIRKRGASQPAWLRDYAESALTGMVQ